jgi:hypothetical protein
MLVISVPTTPARASRRAPALGDHQVQQFVAVEQAAVGVDHLQAVGVAVERDAVVGLLAAPRSTSASRVRGADVLWLMFRPSGEQPMQNTSAPSSWNTLGAMWYAAPWPHRPRSSCP